MDETTSIDVPEVHRMSDATLDVAGRLERLGAGIEPWKYAAQGAVPGSVTSETGASGAARHWETTLDRLAEEVRLFGGDLRQAAADYQAADEAASRRVRQAGPPR